MFVQEKGANEITLKDIEDFLKGDGADTPPADENAESSKAVPPVPVVDPAEDNKTKETQAFARRLKEETGKVRNEERNNVAKSLGYESYEAMQKANEQALLKDKGLDPEEVAPVVEQIVAKRLADDPRLKELESYRQQKVAEWAKKELVELKGIDWWQSLQIGGCTKRCN